MAKFFENAPLQAEMKMRDLWSEEAINASKEMAQQIWKKLKSSPADLEFERAIERAFPNLNEEERRAQGDTVYECISLLAQQDHPEPTGKITPDEFKRFGEAYLQKI
jgi:hypothetical protein